MIIILTYLASYDPEYEAFEFGKLSALREIALALETPYRWYCMGENQPFIQCGY